MATINEINEQILRVGASVNFLIKSDINALPSILTADEKFLHFVSGNYKDRNSILVLTNKRLLFVHKKLIAGISVEDFLLNKVTTIQYNSGLLGSEITVFASGNEAKIKHVSNVKSFVEMAQAEISKMSDVGNKSQSSSISSVELLEKLLKLKEAGILTDEEFLTEKKKILSQL